MKQKKNLQKKIKYIEKDFKQNNELKENRENKEEEKIIHNKENEKEKMIILNKEKEKIIDNKNNNLIIKIIIII